MSQLIGVRFGTKGQVYYFTPNDLELPLGTQVVVETEQGLGFGTVVHLKDRNTLQDTAPNLPTAHPKKVAHKPRHAKQCNCPLKNKEFHNSQDSQNPQNSYDEEDALWNDSYLEDLSEHEADILAINSKTELLPVLRIATPEDTIIAQNNVDLSKTAVVFCKECIQQRKLDMKLVDVEVFFDKSKILFYFTAPSRIDFRELVKDLVRNYRTRIELRQIGVRHETQMVGAVGNCGMVCCCRRFLTRFAPVTIKMGKEQNLFLNPAKISGVCGRLLCCLAYEQETYDEFYNKCPKINKKYQTDKGILRVQSANMFQNTVTVLTESNQELEISLEEWPSLHPCRPEFTQAETPAYGQRTDARQPNQPNSQAPNNGLNNTPNHTPNHTPNDVLATTVKKL